MRPNASPSMAGPKRTRSWPVAGSTKPGSPSGGTYASVTFGGFTTGKPWLPLGADVAALNVEAQVQDPASMLALYRALLRLRRTEPVLSVGTYTEVTSTDTLLAYERRHLDGRLLIALNMSNKPQLLDRDLQNGRILLSTDLRDVSDLALDAPLNPYEGWIVELGATRTITSQ